MKLYYLKGACSFVPHTALIWAGVEFDAQAADRELIKSPEYLALNPQGAVPLLVDGDLALSQNVAILAYLDANFPRANLFGSQTLKGKAEAYRWLLFFNADIHKAFSALFHLPDWAAQDEKFGALMQQAARENILRMLKIANDHLVGREFVGEAISVADVYLYVLLRWCKAIGLDYASLSELEPFYQRIAQNAGVQAALAQEELEP